MDETSHYIVLSDSILKTLLYYDIFSYPLTSTEVFRFLPTNGVTHEDVSMEMNLLTNQGVIFRLGNFYSIQNNLSLATRRERGNAKASENMKRAQQRAKLISRFPFVRSVMISGSLSKGFMDEKSDIDFFIVTEPGRLWIARTLLVMFKRVFLRNSHRNFCVNYFIDSLHLEIEEKNLFTATELATLIPIVNGELYVDLLSANRWIKSFFPNYAARPINETFSLRGSKRQSILERMINTLFGKKLEIFFKDTTYRHWKKKYDKLYSVEDFNIAFKTTDHTSKGHPGNYQRKVIELYQQKIVEFTSTKSLTLPV